MVREVLSEKVTFAQTPESQKPDEPWGTGAMEPVGYVSSRVLPFTHLSIHLYSPLPPSTHGSLCSTCEPVEACLGQTPVTQGTYASLSTGTPCYQGWGVGPIPKNLRELHAPPCPGPDLSPILLHLPGWQCPVLPLGPDPAGVNTRNIVIACPTYTHHLSGETIVPVE